MRKSKETIETERLILGALRAEQVPNDIAMSSGQYVYEKLKKIVNGEELKSTHDSRLGYQVSN